MNLENLEAPKTMAESVAVCNEMYRILVNRLRAGGKANTIPKYKAFAKLFHTLVAVCGEAMTYKQSTCNALAIIAWLSIKYDHESLALAYINPDPVFEFVANCVMLLNRMVREAKKKDNIHVLFGPFSKN